MATKQNLNSEETEKKTKTASSRIKTAAAKKTAEEKKTAGTKATVKKTASSGAVKSTAAKKTASASKTEAAEKKTTTVKKAAAVKKTETAEKKPVAAKKTSASKTTEAKTAEKKTAVAKTTTAKKTAAEKSEKTTKATKTTRATTARKIPAKVEGLSPTGVMVKEKPVVVPAVETKPAVEEKSIVAETKIVEAASEKTEEPKTAETFAWGADRDSAYEKTEEPKAADTFAWSAAGGSAYEKTEDKKEDDEEDFRALEQMMQTSGLRKKSENSYAQYKEKKGNKKLLLLLLLLLALFGAGIGIGVKFFTGNKTEITMQSPEDIIAYCERLIGEGQYAKALEILAGLDISGDDENSINLRRRASELMSLGFEKAIVDGKENEILEVVRALSDKGKYGDALKILAAGSDAADRLLVSGGVDAEKANSVRNSISAMEKDTVEKAVSEGRGQDVIDTAKKLVDDGAYVPALEMLSYMDVKGNDTVSRLLRNQAYALRKDAVDKAVADGKAGDVLDLAERLSGNGKSVEALEVLSYAKIIGDDAESKELRERLSKLKKDLTDKAISEGKKDEIVAKAKQMISDGDYSTALGFLSAVDAEGDDQESRALRNSLKGLKKDTVERALAEGRIDDVLDTADNLSAIEEYGDSLELLSMINVSGKSPESQALRDRVNAKKTETVQKAIKDGKMDDILADARQMIDDGDYSGALELLSAAKIDGNDDESKKIRKDIDSLKGKAVRKAVDEGRGDEVVDTAEKLMKSGDFVSADEILKHLGKEARASGDKDLMAKADRLSKQNDILSSTGLMTDDEKLKLADKLIKEGRYDEALTLLNSIDADGKDPESKALKEKISNLKKDAVAKAKKNGVDLGVLGYDENGEPVLSKEEVARRQQQEKAAKEAAERKAEEEKLVAQIKKEQEEKRLKEEAARKAAEEKRIKEEAAKKAAEEKRLKEEAAKKAAEEKRLKEESAKKAAEEKRLKEEAAKKAAEDQKKAADASARKAVEENIARGKKLLEQGDVEGALKEFEKAKSMLPADDKKYTAEKLSEMAKAMYDASEKAEGQNKKKLEKVAGETARNALQNNSTDPDTLFIASIDALNRRNFAEAERLLEDAISKNPVNYMYYYQLGRVLAMQKKYDKSLNAFLTCNKLNDGFAPSYYNSGYVSEQMGKKAEALVYYQKATEANPSHENAYIGQGHVLRDMKNPKQAMNAFAKALALNPNRSQIYQELGSCCVEEKNYSQAENYFKKALQCPDATNDKNALTYYNLSTVMYDQGKKTDALDYAKKAYDSKDKTEQSVKANVVYNYGLVMQDTGKEDEALALYKEALSIDPKHVKANTNLGVLLLKNENAAEAVIALTNAYNSDPENFEVNNNLGSAYRQIANYEKSAVHYKKALDVKPDDYAVKQNLARTYAAGKDYENAKAVYKELIAKDPNNKDHWYELANIAYDAGDKETAAGSLANLKKIAPTYQAERVDAMLRDLGY
ncbi:MAG: tetratricopeptide repeat protein [Treponema sp.]|nr:tetratricopeptide repeat protein [Candidatus Treponema equi]